MRPALIQDLAAPLSTAAPEATVRRMGIAMGTSLALEASAPTEAGAQSAVAAAFAAVKKIDCLMNPDRPGSDLERLNSAAPGTRVPIDPSTREVLRLAQRFHRLTDGVFDPCLPGRRGRLCDLELGPARAADAVLSLEAADGGTVAWAICHAPLTVDLGGIGKGYAVDRAVETLIAAGCSAGLVNAGGDLRVFGSRRVPLLLRHADGSYEPIELANEALAVSDAAIARAPSGHRGYYSRLTDAAPARRQAAVVAADAVTADALTKCALLCPSEQTARLLCECGARLLD